MVQESAPSQVNLFALLVRDLGIVAFVMFSAWMFTHLHLSVGIIWGILGVIAAVLFRSLEVTRHVEQGRITGKKSGRGW